MAADVSGSWFARGVDALVEQFAPGAAVRRQQARRFLAQYEAGGPTQRTTSVKRSTTSGDSLLDLAGTTVRERARWLDENHDVAIGILDVLVDNIVGHGILVEPQVLRLDGTPHVDLNKKLRRLHENWAKRPEVTWQFDLGAVERMAALHWLRDGEVLTQLVSGGAKAVNHGTAVPFSLELIEADFLPLEFNDLSRRIRQGIERDTWGRPVAYHLYRSHPLDRFAGGTSFGVELAQLKRVPADNMLFLRWSRRLSQLRGMSILVSVINRLGDVKQYEDYERIAAQVAAALTVFIGRSAESDCPSWLDQNTRPERSISPGMLLEGAPGEKPEIIQSNRPSNQIEPFRKINLKAAAAGVGAGYSSIAKSYEGNYSSQRQELVEQGQHYRALRRHFIERFSRPIYERFVQTALLAGLLDKDLLEADMETLDDAQFTGAPMPWIDPVKEIEAVRAELELGLKSRSQAIRERGGNPREVATQIEQDDSVLPTPTITPRQPAPARAPEPTDDQES